MSDIGKGDWVECIDDWLPPGEWYAHGAVRIRKGGIYRVKGTPIASNGTPMVRIKGSRSLLQKGAWAMSAFRPIYRSKQEIIEALKAPPKRVKERV